MHKITAKLNGKKVDVALLWCVELYGVTEEVYVKCEVNEGDFPKRGEMYLCQAVPEDNSDVQAWYDKSVAELREWVPDMLVPCYERLHERNCLVWSKAKYHVAKDENGKLQLHFDSVKKLNKCYELDDQDVLLPHAPLPKETAALRRKYWKDYLYPIPPPPPKFSEELYLPMQYEPYDWIESGEKTTEFRAYDPYWVKKILSHPLKTVRFQRGYGGPGHPPPRIMRFEIKKIYLYDHGRKIECDPWKLDTPIEPDLIAIDLGLRIA